MKFVSFVSVLGIFFLTACGPQIYYDPRISSYQKVMEKCAGHEKQVCQDEYDSMVLSFEREGAQYASPFIEPETNVNF